MYYGCVANTLRVWHASGFSDYGCDIKGFEIMVAVLIKGVRGLSVLHSTTAP